MMQHTIITGGEVKRRGSEKNSRRESGGENLLDGKEVTKAIKFMLQYYLGLIYVSRCKVDKWKV